MKVQRLAVMGCLLVSGLLVPHGVVTAEGVDPACPVPILGIIEGPDPIPLMCNEEQVASEAAGALAVAFDPDRGRLTVVWAAEVGGDHDIAISEWSPEGWGRPRYLTSTTADDVQPAVFLDPDGALHVTWWQRGPRPRVFYTRRDPLSLGWTVDHLVAEDGRAPTVAVVAGDTWLAFERRLDGGRREIVVARQNGSGEFVEEIAAISHGGAAPLELALHAAARGPRVSWTDADGVRRYSERHGGRWSPAQIAP